MRKMLFLSVLFLSLLMFLPGHPAKSTGPGGTGVTCYSTWQKSKLWDEKFSIVDCLDCSRKDDVYNFRDRGSCGSLTPGGGGGDN